MTTNVIFQQEPTNSIYKTRLEEFTREITSRAASKLVDPVVLKYLNLDMGSNHVFVIKGKLEMGPNPIEKTQKCYTVNGVNLLYYASRDIEDVLRDCQLGDFLKVALAPKSMVVLDISKS